MKLETHNKPNTRPKHVTFDASKARQELVKLDDCDPPDKVGHVTFRKCSCNRAATELLEVVGHVTFDNNSHKQIKTSVMTKLSAANTHTHTHTHMCVCVCVCV